MGGHARDHFDFVAGTSTGALIAAAVAAGVPGERIVQMYVERAPALFRKVPVISTISRILFGRMYDVQRLHRLITEEMASEGAGEWTLNDVPLDILITAKGLLDSHQWYFVKDRPDRRGLTGDLRLADCLTASAAAPTFFAPWLVDGLRERGPMVDGGTGRGRQPGLPGLRRGLPLHGGLRAGQHGGRIAGDRALPQGGLPRPGSTAGWAGSWRSCCGHPASSRPSWLTGTTTSPPSIGWT